MTWIGYAFGVILIILGIGIALIDWIVVLNLRKTDKDH